jgi:hypothetical protein
MKARYLHILFKTKTGFISWLDAVRALLFFINFGKSSNQLAAANLNNNNNLNSKNMPPIKYRNYHKRAYMSTGGPAPRGRIGPTCLHNRADPPEQPPSPSSEEEAGDMLASGTLPPDQHKTVDGESEEHNETDDEESDDEDDLLVDEDQLSVDEDH